MAYKKRLAAREVAFFRELEGQFELRAIDEGDGGGHEGGGGVGSMGHGAQFTGVHLLLAVRR